MGFMKSFLSNAYQKLKSFFLSFLGGKYTTGKKSMTNPLLKHYRPSLEEPKEEEQIVIVECFNRYKLDFKIGPVKQRFLPPFPHKRYTFMTLVLADDQQVTLAVSGTDDRGNPAPLDPSVQVIWAVSDTTLLSVVPSTDTLSCVIASLGPLGTAQVTVSATINNNQVMGTLDVQIVNSAAVTLSITPGVPGPQPTPGS
jgi:hypothetical protein